MRSCRCRRVDERNTVVVFRPTGCDQWALGSGRGKTRRCCAGFGPAGGHSREVAETTTSQSGRATLSRPIDAESGGALWRTSRFRLESRALASRSSSAIRSSSSLAKTIAHGWFSQIGRPLPRSPLRMRSAPSPIRPTFRRLTGVSRRFSGQCAVSQTYCLEQLDYRIRGDEHGRPPHATPTSGSACGSSHAPPIRTNRCAIPRRISRNAPSKPPAGKPTRSEGWPCSASRPKSRWTSATPTRRGTLPQDAGNRPASSRRRDGRPQTEKPVFAPSRPATTPRWWIFLNGRLPHAFRRLANGGRIAGIRGLVESSTGLVDLPETDRHNRPLT